MGAFSRSWLFLHICMYIISTFSGVSAQSSECGALKSVFPGCLCSTKFDSAGALLGTSVDCSSLGLSVIPSSSRGFSIYELKLNNNSIVSLGDSILNNLNITKLDFSDNAISTVHNHTFGYVGSYLQILILSGNSSSQPPKNAFSHLVQLEDLTLKNYNVSSLFANSGYFLSFTKLKHLTLENWNLESIDSGSIQLPNPNLLQSLTLLNQVMPTLPLDELQSPELLDLKTLHISHTNINNIGTESFSKLKSLTELDLSYNKISFLEAGCFVGVNNNLVRLSLSNNKLTSNSLLPGLKDLTNLQQLDLSFNQITTVPDLTTLHTNKPLALYLNNNYIISVSDNAFVGIAEKVNTLDLSDNRIVSIDANFGRFTIIESLFLSHQSSGNNRLTLPSSLRQAAGTLKQLFVGGQTINQLDFWPVVRDLYMLEVLNLTSLQLTSIPDLVLSSLTNLKQLDLSNNSLQNITQDTLAGPRNSLKFLSLTQNSISTLSSCMFYQYTSFPISVLLGENNLNCDCAVKWLWNSIRSGSITSTTGQEAICSDNQPLASKTLDGFCTPPYTEPQCLEYYTTALTIFAEKNGPISIKISWQLSDTNGLNGVQLKVSDSHSPVPLFERNVPTSSTSYVVDIKLVENTRYDLCIEAYFNTRPRISNCTFINIPGNTTDTPKEETGLSQTEIGIIVGVIVGVVVLLALVAAIIYLLVCHRRNQKKMPQDVPVQPRNFTKSELPSMNEETRTFTKPKRSRGAGGPEHREGMQVVAISDGQTGHGRVGRANMLNSDGSFKKTSSSSSSSTSGQAAYENDHGPLPLTPNRHHSTQPPVGYYNKGFKEDSYDEIVPKRESVI